MNDDAAGIINIIARKDFRCATDESNIFMESYRVNKKKSWAIRIFSVRKRVEQLINNGKGSAMSQQVCPKHFHLFHLFFVT